MRNLAHFNIKFLRLKNTSMYYPKSNVFEHNDEITLYSMRVVMHLVIIKQPLKRRNVVSVLSILYFCYIHTFT
jgi:hypothetical protein